MSNGMKNSLLLALIITFMGTAFAIDNSKRDISIGENIQRWAGDRSPAIVK